MQPQPTDERYHLLPSAQGSWGNGVAGWKGFFQGFIQLIFVGFVRTSLDAIVLLLGRGAGFRGSLPFMTLLLVVIRDALND